MHSFNDLLQYFESNFRKEIETINQSEPINLYHPIAYSLENGGKRIRPVLLLMAHNLFSSNLSQALNAAFAIEIFHNFTLLHDDIMDKATLRRNRETVHIKFSDNAAILSGDAMSIISYRYLSKCNPKYFSEIIDEFNQTALKICEGQQFDMDFERRMDVTVDEYLKMIELKTAVLLASSLKIGAILSGTSCENANNLYNFGYNLGIAFQLQDDYLDSFGNSISFGKNIGGDIAANKKTFLLLKSFELANKSQLERLTELLSSDSIEQQKKIASVLSLYNELKIDMHVNNLMEVYYKKAISSLQNVDAGTSSKNELLNIAKKMMKRVS